MSFSAVGGFMAAAHAAAKAGDVIGEPGPDVYYDVRSKQYLYYEEQAAILTPKHSCVNCGAPKTSRVCEYCKTT